MDENIKEGDCQGCVLTECSVDEDAMGFEDCPTCPCTICLIKMICSLDCEPYRIFRDEYDDYLGKTKKEWGHKCEF